MALSFGYVTMYRIVNDNRSGEFPKELYRSWQRKVAANSVAVLDKKQLQLQVTRSVSFSQGEET
jgi:hypothetical protein